MRRKKKKNNKFKIILSILLISIGVYIFIITRPSYILNKKGYDKATIISITDMDKKIVNSVLKVDYKEYMLDLINDVNYNPSKIKDYIAYYESNNKVKIANVIQIVNNALQEDTIVNKLATESFFIYDRLERYLDYYQDNSDLTTDEVVQVVNTNTDYGFYTNSIYTDISKGTSLIVNKYYKLNASYVPNDLVDIDSYYGQGKLQKDAYDHYKLMVDAMKLEGLFIYPSSSYRDYAYQTTLYNNYVANNGQERADTFSAKPGYSEHQTGLAVDVRSATTTMSNFETSDEFDWMQENAHLYGFILRYPEGKEALTGYSYESWHYRYVGIDIATFIYENDITFDEYYAYFIR